MKKPILRQLMVLPTLAAVMAGLYACGSTGAIPRSAPPAPFTQTYVLQQGGSAIIAPAATATAASAGGHASVARVAPVVRLDRVNDSRCRTGAVCVWAGYISFSYTLVLPDGSTSSFVLSDNMPSGTASLTRDGLNFTLAGFTPSQVPAKDETAPDYQVSLKVSNINSP